MDPGAGGEKTVQARRARNGDRKWASRGGLLPDGACPKVWQVSRQPRSDRDHKKLEKISTSLFFTDFPKDWMSRSMWSFFNRFGLVVDIYVPLKRTKTGKRFGFVRYKGVSDIDALTSKIKTIAVGMDPITINLAKFKRRLSDNAVKRTGRLDYHVSPTWKNLPPPPLGPKGTFADALRRGIEEQRPPSQLLPDPPTTVVSDDETKEWLQRCAVGDIKNLDLLHDLPHLLRREGFIDCQAKYVGGFRFLIECPTQELLTKVLSDGMDKLTQWFQWLRPWSSASETTRPGRLVWLNVDGVPLHGWRPSIFHDIATKWGKVIELENFTELRKQIHIGRILIHTMHQDLINEVINLMVDGDNYPVRVMEDFIEVIDAGPRYEIGDTQSRSSIESDNQRLEADMDFSSDDGSTIPESPPATTPIEKLKGRVVESLAGLGVVKDLNLDVAYEEPQPQPSEGPMSFNMGSKSPICKPISHPCGPHILLPQHQMGCETGLHTDVQLPQNLVGTSVVDEVLVNNLAPKLSIPIPKSKKKTVRVCHLSSISQFDCRILSRGLTGRMSLREVKKVARLKAHVRLLNRDSSSKLTCDYSDQVIHVDGMNDACIDNTDSLEAQYGIIKFRRFSVSPCGRNCCWFQL